MAYLFLWPYAVGIDRPGKLHLKRRPFNVVIYTYVPPGDLLPHPLALVI